MAFPEADVRLCIVGRYREQMPPDMAADLDLMTADAKRYSVRVIARSLTLSGYPVKKDAVHSHRLGDCSCPR
jgi:hypothetical protein